MKGGIGAMTDARMKGFFDKMVASGVVKGGIDYKKAYSLQFVNKGVGRGVTQGNDAAEPCSLSSPFRPSPPILIRRGRSGCSSFPPAGITDCPAVVAEACAQVRAAVVVENKPAPTACSALTNCSRPSRRLHADGRQSRLAGHQFAIDAKASFDPMKDVVPIAGTAEYPTAMVVNNKMPVNSVKEFIAYAKEGRAAHLRLDRRGRWTISPASC